MYGDVWSGQVSDATICISVCMVMSGLVRSLMQLSVFLCVLCVYADVWCGHESNATICIFVCIVYADVSSGQESDATICIFVCIMCVC